MKTIQRHLVSAGFAFLLACGGIGQPAWSQEAKPVVRTYSVHPQPVDEAAQRVQRAMEGVRPPIEVRLDAKSGRVLVRATPDQHHQVAATLRQWRDLRNTTAPVVHDPLVRPAQDVTRTPVVPNGAAQAPAENGAVPPVVNVTVSRHQLQHLTWREFVSGLRNWFGPRLVVQGDNEVERYWFSLGEGAEEVRFDIDGRIDLISLTGPDELRQRWLEAIRLADQPEEVPGSELRFVKLSGRASSTVGRAVTLLKTRQQASTGTTPAPLQGPRLSRPLERNAAQQPLVVAQAPQNQFEDEEVDEQLQPDEQEDDEEAVDEEEQPEEDLESGAIGPVRIELLPGLDAILVRGSRRDVARVMQLINEIEAISDTTALVIEIVELKHTNSEAMSLLINEVNSQVLSTRLGVVSVTPLVTPNALLLVGRAEAVESTMGLISRLDTPIDANLEVRVYRLNHLPVADAQRTILQFYDLRDVGLGPRVRVTADFRTNSLIVYARGRDLDELALLLEKLDTPGGGPVGEVRVFRLRNALAVEVAPVLEDTLRGDPDQQLQGQFGGGFGGAGQAAGTTLQGQQVQTQSSPRSTALSLTVIDAEGRKALMNTGFLTDVRVSADARLNALVVVAPPESMDLIAELIRQIDDVPSNVSEIKVFPIVRGSATALAAMLQTLFAQQAQAAQPVGQAGTGGESSLVPLRITVDQRTNSIIAAGNASDLDIVYAILLTLDANEVRERQHRIFRLNFAPADSVALAINQFLQTDRALALQLTPDAISSFEQLEREVVVVPEMVTNSLIISASPRYFDEVVALVRELDVRPPMVMIQVLIAEVTLDHAEEYGAELGIQDSLLFDRSGTVADALVPGFNFNGPLIGNSGSPASLATRELLAGQALSNMGVGRVNPQLGFGGLVLSASNESLNILIRALQFQRRLDILSSPTVTTMNNQPAYVQVGAQVPYITDTQLTQFGTVNSITFQPVGIELAVRPRITPDGLVVMEIDASKSSVGPEADGIPISINQNGDVIRAPQIETTLAQTTLSARDGQTVILGGLITKDRSTFERKVPYISDVPLIGSLFRYDQFLEERTELVFIMTPYIIDSDDDISAITAMSSARMNWCYADVINMHHDFLSGEDPRQAFTNVQTQVIYPDQPSRSWGFSSSEAEIPSGGRSGDAPTPATGPSVGDPSGTVLPPALIPTPELPPTPNFPTPGISPTPGSPAPGPVPPVERLDSIVPQSSRRELAPTPAATIDSSATRTRLENEAGTGDGSEVESQGNGTSPAATGPAVIQHAGGASMLPTTVENRGTEVRATSWQVEQVPQQGGATVTEYRSVDNAVEPANEKRPWWRPRLPLIGNRDKTKN